MAKGLCASCYNKAYRNDPKNKERLKDLADTWREENRDYVNKRSREWELANKETVKKTKKKYVSKNLLQYRAQCAKRHAAKMQRTPAWADLAAIKEFYMNCPEGKEVDHIIPLQGKNVSGFHVLENLQYLTPQENRKKHNKF